LYILNKSKRKHINKFVIDPENVIKSKLYDENAIFFGINKRFYR